MGTLQADLTETVKPIDRPVCQLCGSGRPKRLWSLAFDAHPGPFTLWRCRGCGVVFNWPRLAPDAIADQYDGDYYVFAEPEEHRWARATQVYANYLLPLERPRERRRLLDVGSARGHLLALARGRGWDVTGVELSQAAADDARVTLGVPVRVGTLEEQGDLGSFDAVTAVDVIEHVASPVAFVRAIHGVLAPGGHVVLETPNFGGAWRHIGRRRWIGQSRFHLFLFDADALIGLLRQSGFACCRALGSTNLAHTQWGVRPELTSWTQRLPGGVRWRGEHFLNETTPPSLGRALRTRPPESLDDALVWIDAVDRGSTEPALQSTVIGDNLAVIGEAVTPDNRPVLCAAQAR